MFKKRPVQCSGYMITYALLVAQARFTPESVTNSLIFQASQKD